MPKLVDVAHKILRNWSSHAVGECTVCGRITVFVCTSITEARNNMVCVWCRSNSRKRHVAHALLRILHDGSGKSLAQVRGKLDRDVYSAVSGDPLHRFLGASSRFVCSEFFDEVAPGLIGRGGVQCQDLQRLTFADESFDIVITEDVLEHVYEPIRAFKEIHRILRPRGHHIFTIPCPSHTHLSRAVVQRVSITEGDIRHLLPAAYHEDKLRGGVLVVTDFGTNLLEELHDIGFETGILMTQYWLSRRHGIFDSYVFVSQKM